jgi:hypothetical protein
MAIAQSAAAKDDDDLRDILYAPGTLDVPASVLPDPTRIQLLDQGTTPASVGFALAAVLNYLRAGRGDTERVSPLLMYENAKRYDEWAGQEHEGSSLRGALRGLNRHGAPLERDTPPNPGPKTSLSPEATARALENRPASYARVQPNIEHLKAAVYEHQAILCSAILHKGWHSPENGRIHWQKKSTQDSGGHAFAIVGYDDAGFIVQNSWGPDWGGLHLPGDIVLHGCSLWSFEDAAAKLTDAWIVRMSPEATIRVLAGYAADRVDGPDLLEIRREAQAFSYVLASKEVDPPLAIGLFGEWGGGKSFFMEMMQQEIVGAVERAKGDPENSPFCTQVVPIRFNAWHYLDTDLWASLVTEVFDRLFEHIAPTTDISEALKQELQKAQGLFQHAERELSEAKDARNQAEKALKDANTERDKKEKALAAQLDDIAKLLKKHPDTRQRLEDLSVALGAKDLATSFNALNSKAQELKSVGGRFAMLVRSTVGSPAGYLRLLALAGVTLLPLLVAALIEWLRTTQQVQIASTQAQAAQLSTLLAGVTTWLGVQVKQGSGFLTRLEEAHDQLEKLRKARLEKDTAGQQQALVAAREREAAARKSLQEAELKVQAIERDLAEQQPGRRIYRFIEERAKSAEYRSRLGIVSLVRRDFDHLSRLFQKGKDDSTIRKIMPVERIILYIDDLDRCKPDRVIEVLEAVHLLLAFPLFMVVVAVDPRWLRRCLEQHYPDLLASRTQQPNVLANVLPSRPATAQDYLEKIFQVPFTLQPLRGEGFRKLMRGLAAPKVVSDAGPKGPTPPPISTPPPQTTPPGTVATAPTPTPPPTVVAPPAPPQVATAPPPSNAETVERLSISDWELRDLQRLAALFRTPRTVKRFFNTYRFLRASLSQQERNAFVGTEQAPGHYQIVIVLLTVVVSYPNVAPSFLQQLLDSGERPKGTGGWQQFLKVMQKEIVTQASGAQKSRAKAKAAAVEDTEALHPARETLPVSSWEAIEWRQLCAALADLTDHDFPSAHLDDALVWVPRVARYSFSLSALLTLREQ